MNENFLNRWKIAAEIEEIPTETYRPLISLIRNLSGKSNYTFGVILNEHRNQRSLPQNKPKDKDGCRLCNVVTNAEINPKSNLLSGIWFDNKTVSDFIVTPNKFPIIQGFSLAITKQEREIYTTKDLSNFITDFTAIQDICKTQGLEAFHNGNGFGASIPKHEHWHLITFMEGYKILGSSYGFDAAEKIKVKGNDGVSIMPSFPFAHLIFEKEGYNEKMLKFLQNIQKNLGSNYEHGAVPHIIAEGRKGYLIAISKKYHTNYDIGCAEVAGHFIANTKNEFFTMNYERCIKEIAKFVPTKKEVKLEKFI